MSANRENPNVELLQTEPGPKGTPLGSVRPVRKTGKRSLTVAARIWGFVLIHFYVAHQRPCVE